MAAKLTRRAAILRVAAAGGYGAAMAAMSALGVGEAARAASPDGFGLPENAGAGRSVTVVGAGISGLVAAYELRRAGFDVVLLEARERVGGRNWSIRGGDRIAFTDGTTQTAGFGDGLYFNAGPARLPSHHQTILGYCRTLGVGVEPLVNASRSAFVGLDGEQITQRRIVNDARGYVSELLARSTRAGALDKELTADDRQALLAFLKDYGDLGDDGRFHGTTRSGFRTTPGVGDERGEAEAPLDLRRLLDPRLRPALTFEEGVVMQPTMLQPVGGMDQIPKAFARALGPVVRLGQEVVSIRQDATGVDVAWRDRRTGAVAKRRSDHLVVALPLPILARLDTNFSAAHQAAFRSVAYHSAVKVAWDTPRFWEARDNIYGGISWVDGPTRLVWYPSNELHAARGTLIGAYLSGDPAYAFGDRPLAEQIAASRAAVELLHPGQSGQLDRPVVVAWHRIPDNLGSWVHWQDRDTAPEYRLLNQPHGRTVFAGEHLSQYDGGWQEGAALSGQKAASAIVRAIGGQNKNLPI